MVKKIVLGVFLLILALISFAIYAILIPAGTFKNIDPHFDGATKTIPIEIPGPEDIEIDRKEGLVFISVDDRRSNREIPGSINGGILFYTIDEGITSIKNITPTNIEDFHPHGISLFRSNDSTLYLFTISHQAAGNQVVERFEWKNNSLIHIETIEDKNIMTSPNDLVAIGERNFYVTNDHFYMHGTSRVLEEYLQRPISFVNYFDGKSFQTVATDIGYANGINQSPDGKYIFVAASSGRVIYVYEKEGDHTLNQIDIIELGTGPDNIDFDETGNLLVACHPQLLKFVAHSKEAINYSPSQVLKINFKAPKDYTIEEVFLNDGTNYSGSSIAVEYGNTMIIGSVFEPSLLQCTLNQ